MKFKLWFSQIFAIENLVNEKIWFFHPLCEGAFEDESDIAMAYRQQLNVRLNMVATSIMTSLIGAASKSSAESNFTPTQLEFMVQLKDVDNTTLKNFSKYIRTSKFDRSILNIFVSFVKITLYSLWLIVTIAFLIPLCCI